MKRYVKAHKQEKLRKFGAFLLLLDEGITS